MFVDIIIFYTQIKEKGKIMARKKTTTKSKASKKPMQFSDGVDHLREESKEAKDLEQLMGFKEKNPFGYDTSEAFESAIETMPITSLQELAVKSGVFPSGTKAMLKTKLKKAYSQYTSGGANKVVQITKPIIDPESEQGKKLLKILGEQF